MVRRVDGGDNELIDVVTPLLDRLGQRPGRKRVVEQLAHCQQRGIDAHRCQWQSGRTSATLGLAL
jgi:hypothetical protein